MTDGYTADLPIYRKDQGCWTEFRHSGGEMNASKEAVDDVEQFGDRQGYYMLRSAIEQILERAYAIDFANL